MTHLTIFDANVYRALNPERFGRLLASEVKHGVRRAADYWTLLELLAHLADPSDPSFGPCRAAVRRLWTRCFSGLEDLDNGMLEDCEAQLARIVTGISPPANVASTRELIQVCRAVAETPPSASLAASLAPQLESIARHVARTEHEIAQQFRGERLGSHDLPLDQVRLIAAVAIVEQAHRAAGREVPDPVPNAQVQKALRQCLAGIEFYLHVRRRVLLEGVALDRPPGCNLCWDLKIAFSVGQVVGTTPILLITDDQAFHEVARACHLEDRVATLVAYEAALDLR